MEKLWVFDFTNNRVACITMSHEEDVAYVLKNHGFRTCDCEWMSTENNVELEIM